MLSSNVSFLPMRQSLSILSGGVGKFCLVHWLSQQLTRNVKHEVRTLNFRRDVTLAPTRKTPNDVRKRSLCNVKCKKIKEMTKDT